MLSAIKLRGLQADTALSVQIKHKSSFPEEDTNQNHHQFSECVELVNAYSLIDINRKERALWAFPFLFAENIA